MATPVQAPADRSVTIHPYFIVADENLDAFRALCEQFVARAATEPQCLYYGFSFHGNEVFCREGYEGAEAALAHFDNVGPLLEQALEIAELARLEIHGTEEELAKLREPLSEMEVAFFTLNYGFRR